MALPLSQRLGLTPRVARIAAQAAVATLIAGGIAAYVHAEKQVTLTVDGKTKQVSVFADTVEELLEDEGVEAGARDLVAPARSETLQEGDTVVVRYGRPLTVVVDGQERTYWTTETTVDTALVALGLRADGARLSASRSAAIGRQGLSFAMFTPKAVTVTDGGVAKPVTTTAATVGDLLAELKITVGPLDTVSTVPSTAVTPGLAVAVNRVANTYVKANEAIAFGTKKVSSASLYKGQTKVVTAGKSGLRVATYRVTTVNGKLWTKRFVSAELVRNPVTQVVQVGTKAKPVARSSSSGGSSRSGGGGSVPGAGGLNWAALAQCESGGNPRIVSSNGLYHGLYQFSVSTWRSVGGSGLPSQASASEQTYRAQVLYSRAGASPWPVCGRRLFS